MPAEGFAQIARALQVRSDQSGVLVDRTRVTFLDRAGETSMQLRAHRPQLRLVGHRADQRVPERVPGVRGEYGLIDELRIGLFR
jgi:hypothetical protein